MRVQIVTTIQGITGRRRDMQEQTEYQGSDEGPGL